MSESEKARARAERFRRFGFSAHVRRDQPGMQPVYDAVKAATLSPKHKKILKEARKRASALAAAQRVSGPGLYVDTYLRHFVQEYNGRVFAGQGIHMPNSYNIMRSFIEPDEQAMVFRLLPEQFNAISFGRLLDHVTDPGADHALKSVADRTEELTVFEINMLGGYAEFKIPGAEDYVFCGAAFCREQREISLVGVFGRANPTPRKAVVPTDPDEFYPGKDFLIEGADTIDMSDEAFFGDPSLIPVILMTRIDAERGKVQVRYVLEETKDTFNVWSDDPQIAEYMAGKRGWDDEKLASYLKQLDAYDPLFELLMATPSCLTLMESDDVTLERHPTKLRLEPKSRDAKLAAILPMSEAPRYVTVRTLFHLGSSTSKHEFKASDLSIEAGGYWKTLPLGSEGRDRNGQPVQGKTWVTTQASWFEARASSTPAEGAVVIETPSITDDVGYLYVMRSALHPRDYYKVGYTTKDPEERARQLASTSGQPDVFNVVQSWRIRSPRLIEHQVHELLKEHRVNMGREFFLVRYEKIREVIERVIEKAAARADEATS